MPVGRTLTRANTRLNIGILAVVNVDLNDNQKVDKYDFKENR